MNLWCRLVHRWRHWTWEYLPLSKLPGGLARVSLRHKVNCYCLKCNRGWGRQFTLSDQYALVIQGQGNVR